ncbi:hypothetical protein NDU88_009953 [Pleurodeles waltl]|uniref:Uncharacterized protein n=1 Tax=Pleurodeles waltl TaxID=8319 RepID=A0AAV7QU97_PLEWA|nr:hypothetical protein NDU88_009953 [Pleurodeles waltl]
MVWAYFCWRDGGGLVIAIFSLTFGVADFCGCRVFGGLPVAGQNDRGGLPQPRRCYGILLAGGKRLLPRDQMILNHLANLWSQPFNKPEHKVIDVFRLYDLRATVTFECLQQPLIVSMYRFFALL